MSSIAANSCRTPHGVTHFDYGRVGATLGASSKCSRRHGRLNSSRHLRFEGKAQHGTMRHVPAGPYKLDRRCSLVALSFARPRRYSDVGTDPAARSWTLGIPLSRQCLTNSLKGRITNRLSTLILAGGQDGQDSRRWPERTSPSAPAVGDVAKVCWRREYVRSAGWAMECLPGGRVALRLSRPKACVHRRFDTNEPLLSKFGCVGHTQHGESYGPGGIARQEAGPP